MKVGIGDKVRLIRTGVVKHDGRYTSRRWTESMRARISLEGHLLIMTIMLTWQLRSIARTLCQKPLSLTAYCGNGTRYLSLLEGFHSVIGYHVCRIVLTIFSSNKGCRMTGWYIYVHTPDGLRGVPHRETQSSPIVSKAETECSRRLALPRLRYFAGWP